ncbi:hypothetical protein Agabi119p4_8204 [Agaricus bisporus var. burnettii]|uniref:Uncharacterized protein n=1 Tax=Agaricus bisporus var. burnettii TaxID=192524 RepID=A0A8H7C6A4_AGABI|nr:hypothetical protein Agabi119p4_8204 [Agaricus bisporus var. burnettii]
MFSLVHASLVVFWSTVFLALTTWSMQDVYLDHATYPGGPYEYEVGIFSQQPIAPLTSTSSLMLGILTLGIQVWRVWVIWSSARFRVFIIAFPVIFFVSFIVLGALSILGWAIRGVLPSEDVTSAISTSVYGLGAATTIVVTALATARLLLVRRYHIELMGKSEISNQYVNIVAILTESYALESLWSLVAMILNAIDNPVSVIFIQCENFIRVIAYFLVVHRVSTGRAWSGDTGHELSSLHWNHDTQPSQSETFV